MFLLIHWLRRSSLSIIRPLHSTMFLLIPNVPTPYPISFAFFTFHYVSINTMIEAIHKIQDNFFTFHYVSINTSNVLQVQPIFQTLHSTMFLLILPWRTSISKHAVFTFHYVSINTDMRVGSAPVVRTLHSTMFLLIQDQSVIINCTGIFFTFHYVSINTVFACSGQFFSFILYIPLCFY